MDTTVDRILERLDYVFYKRGWHAPLLTSVQELTAAQAAWVPSPGRNSIWRIVNHIALWKEYYAGRIAGGPAWEPGWRQKLDWQEIPVVTDGAWHAAVQRLTDAHEAVKAALRRLNEDALQRSLPGSQYPLGSSIYGMADHDAYHCGQIRYIRALQGVPTQPY